MCSRKNNFAPASSLCPFFYAVATAPVPGSQLVNLAVPAVHARSLTVRVKVKIVRVKVRIGLRLGDKTKQ